MRYLNKREDFLRDKNSNSINKIKSINEADTSGPFANDVGWNDSLLGRLINHMIRKARIAAKVPTIKRLIERLRAEFDQLVGQSKVFSLSEQDQLVILKITIVEFFTALIKAVEDGSPVDELKGITDLCIKNVTNFKTFDKKDVLLAELKKFREFLDQFGGTTKEEEVKPTNGNTQEIPFDFCIKNLKAVYAILLAYRKLKGVNKQDHLSKKDAIGQEVEVGKEYTYNGKRVKVINYDHTQKASTDKTWLTNDDEIGVPLKDPQKDVYIIWQLGDKNYPSNTTGQAVDASKLQPIKESNEPIATTPVTEPVKQNSILTAIKPVYTYFTSDKDIFPGLESLFKMSPENQQKYGFKAPILKIYNTARLNEDLKQFLSRPEAIGKILITMYKSTKVKEDGSFEGIQDDMKLAIADFNKTMKTILQFQSGIGEKPKKEGEETKPEETKPVETQTKKEDDIDFENKNRSDFSDSVKLLKYNSFMSINEADEPVEPQQQSQVEEDKPEKSDDSVKIREFFNENCKEIIAFNTLTDEEKAVAKKVEETKEDNGIIMSMDPIIEIMKLFIKAYKTYTVQTITKRTENVDTNTLSEYTSFGGGTGADTGRSGPYRNNKLFDMWEEAVNNIRKERKYQALFTVNANLRLPVVTDPDPSNPKDWQIKPKAGLQFNRFINDILDGEKLYKAGSERGKVSTFVDSYFGEGATKDQGVLETNDLKEATEIEASKKKIELEFGKVPVKNEQLQVNTLFTITYTNDKEQKRQRTFLITELKGGYVYMSYALVKHYNKYLNKMNATQKTITKGTLPTLSISDEAAIGYTKVKQNQFNDIFRAGNTITVNSVANDGSTSAPVFKGISDVYWMVKTEDKKIYIIDNSGKPKLSEVITSYQDKNSTLQVESKSGIEIKKS